MSEYSITVKELYQRGYQLPLNHYPIFSESYRDTLNRKIINHFWFREIGAETPDRFSFYLERKMDEIMPYYNQLYESAMLKFNPLENFRYVHSETRAEKEKHTTIDSESEFNSSNVSRNSDGEVIGNNVLEKKEKGTNEYTKQNNGSADTNKTLDIDETTNTDKIKNLDANETNETKATIEKTEKTQLTKEKTDNTEHIGTVTENNTYAKNRKEDISKTATEKQTATEGGSETVTGNKTTTSTSNEDKLDLFSDTPQVSLFTYNAESGEESQISNGANVYATTLNKTLDTTKTNGNETNNETTDFGKTVTTDINKTNTEDNTITENNTDDKNKNDNYNENMTENSTENGNNTVNQTDSRNDTIHKNENSTENDGTKRIENDVEHEVTTTTDTETYQNNTSMNTDSNVNTNTKSYNAASEQAEIERKMFNELAGERGKDNAIEYTESGYKLTNPSKLLMDFRDTILNIDMMIIADLSTLFFGLYDIPDHLNKMFVC